MRSPLFAVLAVASWGCSPYATLSFPNVPTPVLLGPVARIGGASASTDPTSVPSAAKVDVAVEREVIAWRSGRRRKLDDARKASFAALAATDARQDFDVRLEEVRAGSFFLYALAAGWRDDWVTAKGDVRRSR